MLILLKKNLLFSPNPADVDTLYLIFGEFSGVIGLSLYIIFYYFFNWFEANDLIWAAIFLCQTRSTFLACHWYKPNVQLTHTLIYKRKVASKQIPERDPQTGLS
jgi:hypothetical protein